MKIRLAYEDDGIVVEAFNDLKGWHIPDWDRLRLPELKARYMDEATAKNDLEGLKDYLHHRGVEIVEE